MKETIVILGNGFDMALGMKSSYKNFYDNKDFWPFEPKKNNTNIRIRPRTGIDTFLNDKMHENWYDLENLLYEYATNIETVDTDQLEHDKKCFNELKSSLALFIDYTQRNLGRIYSSNKALRFLDAIYENRTPIIYTFNYTAFDVIADSIGHKNIKYNSVHGTIDKKNIVVGIDNDAKIHKEYSFLKKMSEPTYNSTDLVIRLKKAKEVIIFGHSLAKNDHNFFESFFETNSSSFIDDSKRCKITIFTANAESRMDILNNIAEMNGGKNNLLFAQNDLKFIRTKEDSRSAIEEFEDWIKDLIATK